MAVLGQKVSKCSAPGCDELIYGGAILIGEKDEGAPQSPMCKTHMTVLFSTIVNGTFQAMVSARQS